MIIWRLLVLIAMAHAVNKLHNHIVQQRITIARQHGLSVLQDSNYVVISTKTVMYVLVMLCRQIILFVFFFICLTSATSFQVSMGHLAVISPRSTLGREHVIWFAPATTSLFISLSKQRGCCHIQHQGHGVHTKYTATARL